MAKSKSFFGLRKGSTKTMTYSVLRGQQITKDRVTDIANPKTMDQTLQRIPFAQAVKFYKQATKGLFRFAFEDKKPLESDYNAFMRHNVSRAASVSLDEYKNKIVPSIGSYLVSVGSLNGVDTRLSASMVGIRLSSTGEHFETIGEVSELLMGYYPDVVAGDIITIVMFTSTMTNDHTFKASTEPEMRIVQFVVNPDDTTGIDELGFELVDDTAVYLEYDGLDDDTACAYSVIVSRNTPSGLKVSSEALVGNSVWNGIMSTAASPVGRDANAYSWGATEKAILQGSLAD